MKPGLSTNFLKVLTVIFVIATILLFASSLIFFDDASETGFLLIGSGLGCMALVFSLLNAIEKFQKINQFLATLPEDSVDFDPYQFN